MRNPNRIHEVMLQLEELWNLYPDWRFMQLIVNMQSVFGSSMFYMEDEDFVQQIKERMENGF